MADKQTALIVGVGTGLSASLARLLAREGMQVSLAARNSGKLAELSRETGARAFTCDATRPEDVDRLFAEVAQTQGVPDLVVYNASYRTRGPFVDLDAKEVEKTLEITGRADDFRQSLIAKIGAWSLDHKGQKPVMAEIFADLLRKLRDAYFERHKKTIAKGVTELVMSLSGNAGSLSAEGRARAETALATLTTKYGYTPESARDLVGALASLRYRS